MKLNSFITAQNTNFTGVNRCVCKEITKILVLLRRCSGACSHANQPRVSGTTRVKPDRTIRIVNAQLTVPGVICLILRCCLRLALINVEEDRHDHQHPLFVALRCGIAAANINLHRQPVIREICSGVRSC